MDDLKCAICQKAIDWEDMVKPGMRIHKKGSVYFCSDECLEDLERHVAENKSSVPPIFAEVGNMFKDALKGPLKEGFDQVKDNFKGFGGLFGKK